MNNVNVEIKRGKKESRIFTILSHAHLKILQFWSYFESLSAKITKKRKKKTDEHFINSATILVPRLKKAVINLILQFWLYCGICRPLKI